MDKRAVRGVFGSDRAACCPWYRAYRKAVAPSWMIYVVEATAPTKLYEAIFTSASSIAGACSDLLSVPGAEIPYPGYAQE